MILIKSVLNEDQNHHYFGEIKVEKEEFYGAKKIYENLDVAVNNIAISKLLETKANFKYLIGYLDKAIRPLVLILPKMSGYIKAFQVRDGDKDKSNKLMFFRIDDGTLLEKYKTIWTKTEDLKNIKLNALPVCDDRYIKTKMITYRDKVYTNFVI